MAIGAATALVGLAAVLIGVGAIGVADALDAPLRPRLVGGNTPVNAGAGDPANLDAHNSPAVARNPTDEANLVVANRIDQQRFSCALHTSSDGGRTWGETDVPIPAGEEDKCYAPDVAFGVEGTLYVTYVTLAGRGNVPNAVWLVSSDDGGASVSEPVRIDDEAGRLYLTWLEAASDSTGSLRSRSQLIDDMAIALGGRAAEELVFGEPDAGSADDLDRATAIARTMVARLGMSAKLGRPTYASNGGAVGERGPETMTLIDTEIRALVDEAAERARAILAANHTGLEAIADALADRETLLADDLDEIIDPPRQPPTANGAVAPAPPAQRSPDRESA